MVYIKKIKNVRKNKDCRKCNFTPRCIISCFNIFENKHATIIPENKSVHITITLNVFSIWNNSRIFLLVCNGNLNNKCTYIPKKTIAEILGDFGKPLKHSIAEIASENYLIRTCNEKIFSLENYMHLLKYLITTKRAKSISASVGHNESKKYHIFYFMLMTTSTQCLLISSNSGM